jgi:hypothetical protein
VTCEMHTVSSSTEQIPAMTDILGSVSFREHIRGLETLHQKVVDRARSNLLMTPNHKPRTPEPPVVDLPPPDLVHRDTQPIVPWSGMSALSDKVTFILRSRFPFIDLSTISATVRAVALSLDSATNAEAPASPVPSTSTSYPSPAPSLSLFSTTIAVPFAFPSMILNLSPLTHVRK